MIMVSRSPILMELADAVLWQIGPFGIRPTVLKQTADFRLHCEFPLRPYETMEPMID